MKIDLEAIRKLIVASEKIAKTDEDHDQLKAMKNAIELVEYVGIDFGLLEFETEPKKEECVSLKEGMICCSKNHVSSFSSN